MAMSDKVSKPIKDLELHSKQTPNNVGVVTIPISAEAITPVSNMVNLLGSFSCKVHLITGGSVYAFFKNRKDIGWFKNIFQIPVNQC